MANQTRPTEQPKKFGVRNPPQPKNGKQAADALKEQTKTEVEERPYLDTEGGE